MSRYRLDVDFDFDFPLIGISSSLKDYRLCWQINRALNIELCRQKDLLVSNEKKRQEAYFNLFQFEDAIDFLRYFLIANKSAGSLFIPELKQADFFMMLRGDAAKETALVVMEKLKSLPGIEAVFETNPAKLCSRQNLIFE